MTGNEGLFLTDSEDSRYILDGITGVSKTVGVSVNMVLLRADFSQLTERLDWEWPSVS